VSDFCPATYKAIYHNDWKASADLACDSGCTPFSMQLCRGLIDVEQLFFSEIWQGFRRLAAGGSTNPNRTFAASSREAVFNRGWRFRVRLCLALLCDARRWRRSHDQVGFSPA
jgi:hypothetical protein